MVFAIDCSHTHQFRVGVDDLGDALTRKGLFSETPLDIVEDLRMNGVGLVQAVLQMEICRPEAIAKMLCKYPTAV